MRRDLELGVVHEPLLCDSLSASTPSPDRRIQKRSPVSSSGRHAVRLGMRLVRGLATADAARIVASRADEPFTSVEDMWRRSGVPVASLVELAEADAFLPSLSLERPDALWAIKALRGEPLTLFTAAADREDHPREAFGLGRQTRPAAIFDPGLADRGAAYGDGKCRPAEAHLRSLNGRLSGRSVIAPA